IRQRIEAELLEPFRIELDLSRLRLESGRLEIAERVGEGREAGLLHRLDRDAAIAEQELVESALALPWYEAPRPFDAARLEPPRELAGDIEIAARLAAGFDGRLDQADAGRV